MTAHVSLLPAQRTRFGHEQTVACPGRPGRGRRTAARVRLPTGSLTVARPMRASAQVDRATEEPSRIMPPRMVPSSVTILSVATVSVLHVSVSTMRSGAVEQDAVAGRTLPSEEGGG